MKLSENLVLLRNRDGRKLSQDDVSQALGMSRPSYKQLETGEREASIAELKAISELFGVRVEDLTGTIDAVYGKRPLGIDSRVNKIKYKNLILYIAEKIGAQPNVGETVFYKMVYFIETLSISKRGVGLVGESFYKMQYGPVPVSFTSITNEMIQNNELDKVRGRYFTFMQTKYLPRVYATGITPEEKEIIDTIINKLGSRSATYLSDLSHEDRPWLDGENGQVIDLSLISQTNSDSAEKMAR